MGKTVVGDIPPEAKSEGGINALPPAEQQAPASFDESELDAGPNQDPKTGAYRPAKYRLESGHIRIDR